MYMVLGSISNVRSIGGQIQVSEMSDASITGYLGAGTSVVENRTGILEADWVDHEDLALATIAAENFAAAYAVLVVSTVKDPTARYKELLAAAEGILNTIMMGSTIDDDDENPFFIDEVSPYRTYENNPDDIEPYESTR